MRTELNIETLKRDIFSGDWDKMKLAANGLFEIGGQNNIDYLIGLLDQSNSRVRDAVALTFRDNEYQEALEPLFRAINKQENKGFNGTMVYALEKLNCSNKLKELFMLLFEINSWEVQCHALSILEQQTFQFKAQDLFEISTKWETIKEDWDKLNNIDSENLKKHEIDKNVIQDFVDGYVSYLEKK